MFGVFRYRRSDGDWRLIKDDFEYPLYEAHVDYNNRTWFLGHPHALNQNRSELPSRAGIWIMDKTGHVASARNVEEFILALEIPIFTTATGNAGFNTFFFDEEHDLWVGDGWNFASRSWSIKGSMASAHHQGVRVDENEILTIPSPRDFSKGTIIFAIQMPIAREDYSTGVQNLLRLGDGANNITLSLMNRDLFGRVRIDGVWQNNFAGVPVVWNENDIIIIGFTFDLSTGAVELNCWQRNYETFRHSSTRPAVPSTLDGISLGGFQAESLTQSKGYVMHYRVWDDVLPLGHLQHELLKLAEEIYPNGMYPPKR